MVQVPPSQWADLDGPVHYVDFGGPDDGPALVCVHGLGGSHLNWAAIAPALTDTCRVIALDLAGFGHTRGAGRPTSVRANRHLLHRFVTEVVGAPAILVGNSMGGLIASLEAAAAPDTVAGVILIDPALPPAGRPDPLTAAMFAAFVLPVVGATVMSRRAHSSSPEQAAMATLRFCCVDPSRVPVEVLQAHVALAGARRGYPELGAEFLVAARSLMWELSHRRRHAALLHGIRVPVLLLHGERDRLVPVAAARAAARANPHWRFEVAEDIGHVPQLEAADWTVGRIRDWLADEGSEAAAAASVRSVSSGA
jgi:pimeloyl-ACP methyl ester carboxylesterase